MGSLHLLPRVRQPPDRPRLGPLGLLPMVACDLARRRRLRQPGDPQLDRAGGAGYPLGAHRREFTSGRRRSIAVASVGTGCPGVDGIAGGFPCKGASTVGKREGFGHAETVLWFEMARAIGELRPKYVLVENVANILGLHDGEVWGTVLGDLVALGYDVVWDCLPAAAVGAPHLRDRVFAIATHTEDFGHERGWRPRDGRAGLADGGQPAADASRDAEGRTGTPAGADRERARASLDLVANSNGARTDAHSAPGG
jgi:site-specific DNA-cytosine methylase